MTLSFSDLGCLGWVLIMISRRYFSLGSLVFRVRKFVIKTDLKRVRL